MQRYVVGDEFRYNGPQLDVEDLTIMPGDLVTITELLDDGGDYPVRITTTRLNGAVSPSTLMTEREMDMVEAHRSGPPWPAGTQIEVTRSCSVQVASYLEGELYRIAERRPGSTSHQLERTRSLLRSSETSTWLIDRWHELLPNIRVFSTPIDMAQAPVPVTTPVANPLASDWPWPAGMRLRVVDTREIDGAYYEVDQIYLVDDCSQSRIELSGPSDTWVHDTDVIDRLREIFVVHTLAPGILTPCTPAQDWVPGTVLRVLDTRNYMGIAFTGGSTVTVRPINREEPRYPIVLEVNGQETFFTSDDAVALGTFLSPTGDVTAVPAVTPAAPTVRHRFHKNDYYRVTAATPLFGGMEAGSIIRVTECNDTLAVVVVYREAVPSHTTPPVEKRELNQHAASLVLREGFPIAGDADFWPYPVDTVLRVQNPHGILPAVGTEHRVTAIDQGARIHLRTSTGNGWTLGFSQVAELKSSLIPLVLTADASGKYNNYASVPKHLRDMISTHPDGEYTRGFVRAWFRAAPPKLERPMTEQDWIDFIEKTPMGGAPVTAAPATAGTQEFVLRRIDEAGVPSGTPIVITAPSYTRPPAAWPWPIGMKLTVMHDLETGDGARYTPGEVYYVRDCSRSMIHLGQSPEGPHRWTHSDEHLAQLREIFRVEESGSDVAAPAPMTHVEVYVSLSGRRRREVTVTERFIADGRMRIPVEIARLGNDDIEDYIRENYENLGLSFDDGDEDVHNQSETFNEVSFDHDEVREQLGIPVEDEE
jgi:hypothetical protein